jgi:hypothetical protein
MAILVISLPISTPEKNRLIITIYYLKKILILFKIVQKAITQNLIMERQVFLVVIPIDIGITANFNEYISGNCQG